MSQQRIDVLLLDKNLKKNDSNINSLEYIGNLLHQQPSTKILVITGDNSSQDIVSAIKMGAFGFIRKDESPDLLLCQLQKAVEFAALSLNPLISENCAKVNIQIGAESKVMRNALHRASAFARGRSPVLILGETGTGKSLLAQYMHTLSSRNSGANNSPFIGINISALPVSLLERELFGSEKGAFTDAKELKQGYFELANGGTLFLDEIGEISSELQVKLLKVIEEKCFYRLGGQKLVESNFKLICATNRDLEELVREGHFREDLYMRISTFTILMPPLAERKEDILPIVRAALPRWASECGVNVCFDDLPKELLNYLSEFKGRGNVRGLEQLILRLFALSPKKSGGKLDLSTWIEILQIENKFKTNTYTKNIQLDHLSDYNIECDKNSFSSIDSVLEQFEKLIYQTLSKKCDTSRELADILKTSPANVSLKLKKYGLK